MRRRRSRRRSNSPWGTTVAERDHDRSYQRSKAPKRRKLRRGYKQMVGVGARSRATGRSGVCLGTLDDLELEDGRHVKKSALRGAYLAWMPSTDDFAVVFPSKGRPGRLSPAVQRIHRQFHDVAPQRAVAFEWPDRVGTLRSAGRVRSLTYIVPRAINSPEKQNYRWVHAFGDHGESGHGEYEGTKTYPTRLMPELMIDQRNHMFIKRRPGNRYDVTKWIYW